MEIYTDGATSNNGYEGARGGWAYIILNEDNEIVKKDSGYIANATNNICELTALIKACEAALQFSGPFTTPFIIYSDSAYAINCYKQKWYEKWLSNGWVNSKKQPVANKELWIELIPFFQCPNFIFDKVKGHDTNFWNNYVDKMAVEAKQ